MTAFTPCAAACAEAAGVTADTSAEDACDKMIEQFTSRTIQVDGLTGDGMTWDASRHGHQDARLAVVIKDGAYVSADVKQHISA